MFLTGIDIPFGHLVAFYIKAMFAAVPAVLIAGVIILFVRAAFA